MKLLVVDLKDPINSFYSKHDHIGSYLLGRRVNNYALFAVTEDNELNRIELTSFEVTEIQKEVNRQWELFLLREEVKELKEKLSVYE